MKLDSPYLIDNFYLKFKKKFKDAIYSEWFVEEGNAYYIIVLKDENKMVVIDTREVVDDIYILNFYTFRKTDIGRIGTYDETKKYNNLNNLFEDLKLRGF